MAKKNQMRKDQTLTLARDRISQVYLGLQGSAETQATARRRVHWIAAQARGPKVLDVGCSEGILAILLAREGLSVTGVEVNHEALDYARDLLSRENDFVRQRVTLIHSDIAGADLETESFDTVLLGEILEHQFNPEILLAQTLRYLKRGGMLVLTTPYGHHPDPDHRVVFSLSDIVGLLQVYCAPTHLSVADGYIRFTGIKEEFPSEHWTAYDDAALLQLTEDASIAKQIQLYKRIEKIRELQVEQYTQLRIEQRELETLRSTKAACDAELLAKAEQLKEVREYLQAERKGRISAEARLDSTEQRLQTHKDSLAYQMGYALVLAVAQPGRNTILLPFRLVAMLFPRIWWKSASMLSRAMKKYRRGPYPKGKVSPSAVVDRSNECATMKGKASCLPTIGWPKLTSSNGYRFFSVLDEFSQQCFAPECNLISPRPDNWRELAERDLPQLLFVESAWKGNGGCWQYRVGTYADPPGRELPEMVSYFNKKGIPTVFWNKEDPVHFEKFIQSAQLFDVILTTDGGSLEAYRSRTKAKHTGVLTFAAQPKLHNPIREEPRNNRVCFAGSFYANRHEQRRDEQLMLLDAAVPFGLDIFDRNFGLTGPGANQFKFPERLQPHVQGRLAYNDTIKAYKRYRLHLNVNSVVDSPTMFSRRVFELLASGTPVVSTYSRAIENVFGEDVVCLVQSEREAQDAIQELMTDDREWRRKSLSGIRSVFSSHTYAHRLSTILSSTSLVEALEARPAPQRVLLMAAVRNTEEMQWVREAFLRQTWADKHLLILSEMQGLDPACENCSVCCTAERSEEAVRDSVRALHPKLVGILSPNRLYGKHYVEDMVYSFQYADVDLVGKALNKDGQYCMGAPVDPLGFLIRAESIERFGLDLSEPFRKPDFFQEWRRKEIQVFASDDANFAAAHDPRPETVEIALLEVEI